MFIELTQEWLGYKKGSVLNLLDSVAYYLIGRDIAIVHDDDNPKEKKATIQEENLSEEDTPPSSKRMKHKKDKMYRSYKNK